MDYIAQKQLLLNQILENTQAQTSAIEGDEVEKLESLISQRGIIMEQVDELGQGQGDAEPGVIKELLRQIITIDNGNRLLMEKGLEDVKDELRKVRIGRQHEGGYGSDHGLYKEEGIFFDTKE